MKIIKTYNWNRRDFRYDAECEHCKHVEKNCSGYDDSNYYNNVVPDKKCGNCGESSNSKKIEGVPETIVVPKYDPNITM